MKNVDELKQKIEKKVFIRKLIVYTVNLFLYFNDKGNNSQWLWKVLKIALKIPQNVEKIVCFYQSNYVADCSYIKSATGGVL